MKLVNLTLFWRIPMPTESLVEQEIQEHATLNSRYQLHTALECFLANTIGKKVPENLKKMAKDLRDELAVTIRHTLSH